ncbi:hypothetical protein [Halapricum salinum]|uniref:Conditioned medium-induced protein 4 n=1 Tax=Halapricum salinum TaxID=1457250 RepID=A0A4D6HGY9_9EURY|nr:hypothetical protein [Halapricum salinum]QCC52901.1 hypothetical protein DV733_07545 [Halapricum salinum]
MDEKTEELRDIFMDVAEKGTVTERQQEGHGSLSEVDEAEIAERLRAVVADMRERYDFETGLDDETLAEIVRGFYAGEDDETLARDLDLDAETVFTARMDLHLISEDDRRESSKANGEERPVSSGEDDADAPLSMSTLRDLLAEDADDDTIAAELDADDDTITHFRHVAAAQNRARRASHRFQTAFEDALTDADLSIRLTASVQEDGLEDATDDMETNVSF